MDFYLSSYLLSSFPVGEAIRLIHEHGVAGVEIWVEHLWMGEPDLEALRADMDSRGLGRTLHAPTRDVNLTSTNPGIRRESLRQTLEALDIAARLGAGVVTVHPGRMSTARDNPAGFDGVQLETFARIASRAAELGLTVGIEIMERRAGELVVSPEQANSLVEAVASPACGVTVDIAHAITFCRADGEADGPAALIERVADYIGRVRRIVHGHVSNSDRRSVHLPLDRGLYDLLPALRALRRRHDGPVAVEGYRPGEDLEVVRADAAVVKEWSRRGAV